MKKQNMQFGVVRQAQATDQHEYIQDGGTCPRCLRPTEATVSKPERSYCTNRACNAMVLGEP